MNNIKSAFLSLDHNDFIKALIMAVLMPAAGYVGQVLTAFANGGSFAIDWPTLLHLAIAGAVGYLVKNFLTNSQGQFLSSEPPKAQA